MDNLSEYFSIDKKVIENNNVIIFDLFNYDSADKKLFMIYEKGMVITQEDLKTMLKYNEIYARMTYKDTYHDIYKKNITNYPIQKEIEDFYENVSQKISDLFDNPELSENKKKSEEIINDMIDIVSKDDFAVSSFVTILNYDYYTHTHSLNVSVYAICLGKHIGLEKKDLVNLGIASLLHDLGKSQIDSNIINKNGKLTDEEFTEVKNHPYYGCLIAQTIGINNKDILEGIRFHHEKIDGSGYPKGLKNDKIPLYARIISICDAFDAISTKKSYKASISSFDTLVLMKKEMSNSFDTSLINSFIVMLRG